jgi:hypothetical protein
MSKKFSGFRLITSGHKDMPKLVGAFFGTSRCERAKMCGRVSAKETLDWRQIKLTQRDVRSSIFI